ncbi:MAG: hypothetical protein V2A79_10005 [Planctomycetota bacterium]
MGRKNPVIAKIEGRLAEIVAEKTGLNRRVDLLRDEEQTMRLLLAANPAPAKKPKARPATGSADPGKS